jgi:hypothetical protein
LQQKHLNKIVTHNILKEKALFFSDQLNLNSDFKVSKGYINRFCDRHGIRNKHLHGEKLSADVNSSQEFIKKIHKLINEENLSKNQIFNLDESGLLWKNLPRQTLTDESKLSPKIYNYFHNLKK